MLQQYKNKFFTHFFLFTPKDEHSDPGVQGFSLMELLLVIIIIGLVMTMVIPKLIHLRVEARYEIIRQSCGELHATVEQWIQRSMTAQDDRFSSAVISDYVASLAGREPLRDPFETAPSFTGQWLATSFRPNNWNNNTLQRHLENQLVSIQGRRIGEKKDAPPETVVEDMIPGGKMLKNPFNGVDIFRRENDPQVQKKPVAGALAFTSTFYDDVLLYAFCYQGRDSTTINWESATTFHDGQNLLSAQGIKHCSLFAQYR